MLQRFVYFLLIFFLPSALAWNAPLYNGYNRIWQANFISAADTPPSSANWNIIVRDKNFNNELQRYTKNKTNVRASGSGSLQLIPRRDPTAPRGWTSARIESKYTITPAVGKITRVEGSLRLGANVQAKKKGIWPAFWLLGDSNRRGVTWPACGELDIMENINGQSTAWGTTHCNIAPGGICNEPMGISGTTTLTDAKYHVWRIEFNRRSSNINSQFITWYKDGKQFNRITGAQIANATVWKTLCQSPLFIILDVAVGGDWPGNPNPLTTGGVGSMMEIGYVAHYVSS